MKLFRNKKGVILLYITFMIMAVVIVTIGAVMAPMGVRFNSAMYLAGQDILQDANASIQNISDATIKASVNDAIDSAFNSAANNIEVNANLFQYSWILILGLGAIIIFMFTRTQVEFGSQGGGFI